MNFQHLDIMLPAFFECLVLVGIHSYLGLHVIRRKVIFVDLALAQIAALGTTVGFLFGIMPSTTGAYWFSLTFTFIGAAVFSISRLRHEKIPQEAVIGLAYAIAASVAILVIDKAPHGAEHIKEIMTGSILWVKWGTILKAAIVYSIVGIFHYIFRKQFLLISENPDRAYKKGMNVRFWDFLFYVSFGIVITHSVGTAGVLLVFVFLVVPAIASMLITDVLWKQLAIGWSMGLIVSIVGLYISYIADLPSGPTVVAFYGVMLILIALFLYIFRAKSKKTAGLYMALGIGVSLLIIFGFYIMGNTFKSHYHQHEHHGGINEQEHLIHEIAEHKKLAQMDENELERFLKNQNNISILTEMYKVEPEKYIKIKIAYRAAEIDSKPGLNLMITLLKNCEFPFLREEILNNMHEISDMNFGYDSDKSFKENSNALTKWQNWVNNLPD